VLIGHVALGLIPRLQVRLYGEAGPNLVALDESERSESAWDSAVGKRIVLGNPPLPEYLSQLHAHDEAHQDIHAIFREMRQLLDSYSAEQPRMYIGELDVFEWRVWSSYYGAKLDELHMPFNFGLLRVPWTPEDIRGVMDALEAVVPTGAWPNYLLSNHDMARIASRVGMAQARIALMLLLTLRGTPTMYYGDEIGMHDVSIPSSGIQDPLERQFPGLGRDPARTAMQWDAGPNAGFCPPTSAPGLPIARDYRWINVIAQYEDPSSMLALTRAMMTARRASSALQHGYISLPGRRAACLPCFRSGGHG